MDINCTDPCIYQTDGKCTLNELPNLTGQSFFIDSDHDCPYFHSAQ